MVILKHEQLTWEKLNQLLKEYYQDHPIRFLVLEDVEIFNYPYREVKPQQPLAGLDLRLNTCKFVDVLVHNSSGEEWLINYNPAEYIFEAINASEV